MHQQRARDRARSSPARPGPDRAIPARAPANSASISASAPRLPRAARSACDRSAAAVARRADYRRRVRQTKSSLDQERRAVAAGDKAEFAARRQKAARGSAARRLEGAPSRPRKSALARAARRRRENTARRRASRRPGPIGERRLDRRSRRGRRDADCGARTKGAWSFGHFWRRAPEWGEEKYKTIEESSIDRRPLAANRLEMRNETRRSAAAEAEVGDRGYGVADNEGGEAMFDVALLMRDRDLPSSAGRVFERVNPITGEVATRAAAATVEDAAAAAASAAAAFPAGRRSAPASGARAFRAAAEELERREGDFHRGDGRGDRRDRSLGPVQRRRSRPRCCARPRR